MFDVDGIDVPVVFPEVIQHHQVMATTGWRSPATPVSAGKITLCQSMRRGLLGPLRVEAHGESISLKLKSRPEDSDILTRYFENF